MSNSNEPLKFCKPEAMYRIGMSCNVRDTCEEEGIGPGRSQCKEKLKELSDSSIAEIVELTKAGNYNAALQRNEVSAYALRRLMRIEQQQGESK